MSLYEPVIGIEVHAQLKTNTKLFCGCSTTFGQEVNSNTCPVCLALPGALPVLNRAAVDLAIKAGLALNCTIATTSVFARKNYFYPDLPKGYQISQFDKPICLGGYLDIQVNGETRRIGITRIHMEEDAGKLLHQGADAIAGATHSLADLNRACTPLIEIVSEPDIRDAEEARIYVETLKQILTHLDVCDGNLDEGSMRADANISIRPVGQTTFGTRTEVKNLNSFRSIERAIISEISRQELVLGKGERVVQQTRHYDDATQKTRPLRSKEEAHDYRYFPDPDLLPLHVTQAHVMAIREALPELPSARRHRYLALGLSEGDCDILLEDLEMLAYFETALALDSIISPKIIANWVVGDLNAAVKIAKVGFSDFVVSASKLLELLGLIGADKISGKTGKEVLEKMIETGETATLLVDKMGLSQVTDTSLLETMIKDLLLAHPDVIEKYKSGRTNAADFLIGQVMKQTKGQAKPDLVRAILTQVLLGL